MEYRKPDAARMLDLAEKLLRDGRYAEAESICHEIFLQDADNLEGIFLCANICFSQHRYPEAAELYRRACDLAPQVGFLKINHALVLQALGNPDEALRLLDEAYDSDGTSLQLHYNRGVLLQLLERPEEAKQEFERALALDSRHVGSWLNLSAVSLASGDAESALHYCRHGLFIDPGNSALIGNLATAYSNLFRYGDALTAYRGMLEVVPSHEKAELLGRMANCFIQFWQVDVGIACFERAIEVSTDHLQKRALASTRLFVLHYSSRWSAQAIAHEHRIWGERYFPTAPVKDFRNTPDPGRRIRVAYLSPDLRIHAVVFFLQPVLAAHSPENVAVYCYSDVKKPDAVTRQLKESHGVIWRDCAGLEDSTVEAMLRDDQIDILVDLAGHTGLNRLPLFAGRAAPVQVSWIGYPNTTGLAAMDYRITDHWADPDGVTDQLHTEKLLRLPDSFLCYRPGSDFPEVGEAPCVANGYITFGTFSNMVKITSEMLELWAQILVSVPESRFLFRGRGLTVERFDQEIAPVFERYQVARDRVTMLGHADSVTDNLKDYHRIDIALDTFPYHGTTTTCEAFCMGVPVVTLAGDAHLSRVGVSLLNNVGLADLVAGSQDDYRKVAVSLAEHRALLIKLRTTLRSRLLASPITDNITFTNYLEQAYRRIWCDWCRERQQCN